MQINKEDVAHMNQLIVSMRKRLKNNKKDTINFEK
jgi:ribosomal protein S15P/S13E